MKLYTCEQEGCPVKGVEDNGLVSCKTGDPYDDCPHARSYLETDLDSHADAIIEEDIEDDLEQTLFSNNSLKYNQIKYLALENKPVIATLVGLPNVGKTSLLVSFLYALRMQNESCLRFMGSATLNAWSTLIDKTHYAYGDTPYHPDRTLSEDETRYLHLLVQDRRQAFDLILGDTAGEMFSSIIEYNKDTVEYEKSIQWIKEAKILLLCLDSSEYYLDNLWISKENHTKLIDAILEIIEEYNSSIKIIIIETKYDLIDNQSENKIYHQEVNDYLNSKLGKYIVGHYMTVSITQRQGELSKDIDKILKQCIHITDEDEFIGSKTQVEGYIYSNLKEWLK